MGVLIALAAALLAGAWVWLGSEGSLAFALTHAARYLPPGQTLESRDVSGSLRAGGRIGFLRWRNASLNVELSDARIGWQLEPLLRRRVQIEAAHVGKLTVERRATDNDTPAEPPPPIVPPMDIDLPFTIDDLQWAGPPALQATGLAGRYRYAGEHHVLDIAGVDLADGHYSAHVDLQGPAPMALDAKLDGRVRAALAADRPLDVLAEATATGRLSGPDARLAVAAELRPVQDAPMRARLQANIAPWQPQPVIDARAELENVDLARLWPGAPATLLTGDVQAGPEAASWRASADLRNAAPGPWDRGQLPVERVEAQAAYDGTAWTVPAATVHLGGGRIEVQGQWSPAPGPWQARATVRDVRIGPWHTALSGAPLDGSLQVSQADGAIGFDVALRSDGAGLPDLRIRQVQAQGQWQNQVLDLRALRVDAHGASLDGNAQLRIAEQSGSGNLNLAAPGGKLRAQGRIAPANGDGRIGLRIDDAAGLQRWIEGLPGIGELFAGSHLSGNARLDAAWNGGWQTIQRRLSNEAPPPGGAEPAIQATLDAPHLEIALPSENPLPGPPPQAGEGGSRQPPPGKTQDEATRIALRQVRAELSGSLAQSTLVLRGEAASGAHRLTLDTRASGGIDRPGQWHAAFATLRAQYRHSERPGPWTLELKQAASATIGVFNGDTAGFDIQASGAAAQLTGPAPGALSIDWQPLHFTRSGAGAARSTRLQSKGRFQNLPMAWTEALGASDALERIGFSGDLVFGGDWDIDATDTLRGHVRVSRQSGDLRVQAGEAALVTRIHSTGTGAASEISTDAAGADVRTPAGLRQAELRFDADGDTVRGALAWESERAGQIHAEASTRLLQQRGGWQWAADAPLAGRVTAAMPNLGVWSMLAPPGWRIAGTLEANATLSGRRDDPRWNGTLDADGLTLRARIDGIDLREGRLRARLAGNRVEIAEFSLHGGLGSHTRIPGQSGNLDTAAGEAAQDGGALTASGDLSWGPAAVGGGGIRMAMQARLQTLRALVRADRQLTLSGEVQARLDDGQFTVRGDLRADRAVIILPDQTAPRLGSDVTIRSAARDREAQAQTEAARHGGLRLLTAKPPDVRVSFNLGRNFAVQGHGVTTRLAGQLDIEGTALDAPPRVTGQVRTVAGQFRAYGQQLTIETGVARFNGPMDNPQLDILAIRPNLQQRAGVAINGTAQSPRVRLYSEPPLSDQETLSWLVLGRASSASSAESLLLQQAALALLGGLSGSAGGGLAGSLGLDEIGFKGSSDSGDVSDASITVGKRLSRDFYVTYERSLAGMLGTLFIFYDLTRNLTLRAQAGQISGVDLIFTLKYDSTWRRSGVEGSPE